MFSTAWGFGCSPWTPCSPTLAAMSLDQPYGNDPPAPPAVRGRRRGALWTRVTHGIHRPGPIAPNSTAGGPNTPGLPPPHEADLAGWQLLMTDHGCFTAVTTLAVRRIPLPPLPQSSPVFVALAKDDPRPLRLGVYTSRHLQPVPFETLRGLRVATVPEALLATARWWGTIDLVSVVDAALHQGITSIEELEKVGRCRRPGSRALRASLQLVDGRAESLYETLLRLLHISCGIEVEPQWVVVDDGVEVARADLWVRGTTSVHEYDGDEHEKAPRRVKDLRRARRFDGAGLLRRGYTSDDVIRRGVRILEDADRAVGRLHDPARVRVWNDLLRDSLFTPAGRTAYLARLPDRALGE